MDPSGMGLQGSGLGMQEYLRQKEELRRLKAVIDAAERSMDMQMAGQVGQMQSIMPAIPHQAVAPAPFIYPPGSLPALSLQAPSLPSHMMQETARIVEVDSGSPPIQGSSGTISMAATRRNVTPQTRGLHQGFAQPGPSDSTYSRSSNVSPQAGPSNQNRFQTASYMNYGPMQSSSGRNDQLPVNTHSRATNYEYYRPNTKDGTLHVPPAPPRRDKFVIQPQVQNQSVEQLQEQNVQRSVPINQAVGIPLGYFTRPQMQVSDQQPSRLLSQSMNVLGNQNWSNPGVTKMPVLQSNSRGVASTAEQQTKETALSNGRSSSSMFYTLPPGPGQMPLRRHDHQEPVPKSMNASNSESSSGIALTPGFGPAQSLPRPSTDLGAIEPTSSNSVASPVDHANTDVSENAQPSALSVLTELLANHEQWSEDATSRILKQAMESTDSGPPYDPLGNIQDDEIVETQKSTQPNGELLSPQVPLDQPKSGPQKHAPTMDAPSNTELATDNASSTTLHGIPVNNSVTQSQQDSGQPPSGSRPQGTAPNTAPNTSSTPKNNVPRLAPEKRPQSNGVTEGSLPHTPVRTSRASFSTPASADRQTLARDVIRALLPPSTKRKRDDFDDRQGEDISTDTPVAKKNKPLVPGGPLASGQTINGAASLQEAMASSAAARPSQTGPQQQPIWQRYFPTAQAAQAAHPNQPVYVTSTQASNGGHMLYTQLPAPPYSLVPVAFQPTTRAPPPVAQASAGPSQQKQPTALGKKAKKDASPSKQPSSSAGYSPSGVAQKSPTGIRRKTLVQPKVIINKPPLFLPSSESPPPQIPSSKEGEPRLSPSKSELASKKTPNNTSLDTSSATMFDLQNSEPLFGMPTGILAAASALKRARVRPSRAQAYVLVPHIDKAAWRSRTSKRADTRPQRSGDETTRYDDESTLDLVRDFSRRLIQRSCSWKNCHAILDSGEKLLKHVKIVHGKEMENKLYTCQWKGCQSNRGFTDSEKLVQHIQWHVGSRMYCGYDDCGFQTQLAPQLSEHVQSSHDDSENLRPFAVPVHLVQPDVPTLLEDTIPAYMSVPIPVAPCSISRERHQRIGPLVLQRIFGRVSIKKGSVSAAVPLRSQRLLEKQPAYENIPSLQQFNPQDDYEFLKKEGVTKRFAPLASLPLVIDDIEITEEMNFGTDSVQPSRPETPASVVNGAVDVLQAPNLNAEVTRANSLDLPPENVGSVMEEPRGVVMSPVQDADEVERLL